MIHLMPHTYTQCNGDLNMTLTLGIEFHRPGHFSMSTHEANIELNPGAGKLFDFVWPEPIEKAWIQKHSHCWTMSWV